MGGPGFDSRQRKNIFIFWKASRSDLAVIRPPIHCVPEGGGGAVSAGVKEPGPEADHALPSSSEFKNEWSYISSPLTCLHDVQRKDFTSPPTTPNRNHDVRRSSHVINQ